VVSPDAAPAPQAQLYHTRQRCASRSKRPFQVCELSLQSTVAPFDRSTSALSVLRRYSSLAWDIPRTFKLHSQAALLAEAHGRLPNGNGRGRNSASKDRTGCAGGRWRAGPIEEVKHNISTRDSHPPRIQSLGLPLQATFIAVLRTLKQDLHHTHTLERRPVPVPPPTRSTVDDGEGGPPCPGKPFMRGPPWLYLRSHSESTGR